MNLFSLSGQGEMSENKKGQKKNPKMKRKRAVEKLCASFPDWLPIPEDSVCLTVSWQGQQQ